MFNRRNRRKKVEINSSEFDRINEVMKATALAMEEAGQTLAEQVSAAAKSFNEGANRALEAAKKADVAAKDLNKALDRARSERGRFR